MCNSNGYAEILDFPVPRGFNLSVGKSISPGFSSIHTLGLPSTGSLGFLYTTIPLQPKTIHQLESDQFQVSHGSAPEGTHLNLLSETGFSFRRLV
jgi:hypothetical protein